jgi:subtilisin
MRALLPVVHIGVAFALVGAVAPTTAAGRASSSPRSPYVVVLRDAVDAGGTTDALARRLALPVRFRYGRALKGFATDLTDAQATALTREPSVAYVSPDHVSSATGLTAVAAGESVPPGIKRVGAATATLAHASANTNVAVLDTGVDLMNPDLNATSGTNCIRPGTAAQDDGGHGTHVAGIVGGRNQGAGVTGVAPGTRLYSVKVLSSTGKGTLSQILCGINWLAQNAAALNIRVANMSITGAGSNDGNCGRSNNDAEHQAICGAMAAGVLIVASAGNAAVDFARSVPAAYPEVLTATAMTDTDGAQGGAGAAPLCSRGEIDDSYGTYSSFAVGAAERAHVVAAPGTCVVSVGRGGGTATYTGSSQAAPHVAGTVALCLGTGGAAGPCTGLTPMGVLARVRDDATAGATTLNGFAGDPLRPVAGRYFGPLVRAGAY